MSPSRPGLEVTATPSILGGPLGVTAKVAARLLPAPAPRARSSNVCSVPLASPVTVDPDALVSPGPLFEISLQFL